jgi:predicted nucleotidyltransferase
VTIPPWATEVAATLSRPPVFVTVSGAHLYGFPSVDSDLDLRGVHQLPLAEVVGLRTGPETIEVGGERDGVELDIVSHDLAKFCRLLLRPNGYVLEQLLSPLVVVTGPAHEELVALAPDCLTCHHAHHYLGFAATQWALFRRTGELKPALYTLRVLLTGIHLMRAGEVVADLRRLWEGQGVDYVPDLIAAKSAGEHRSLSDDPGLPDATVLAADVDRLRTELELSRDRSALPAVPPAADAVNDLLIRTRLGSRS